MGGNESQPFFCMPSENYVKILREPIVHRMFSFVQAIMEGTGTQETPQVPFKRSLTTFYIIEVYCRSYRACIEQFGFSHTFSLI